MSITVHLLWGDSLPQAIASITEHILYVWFCQIMSLYNSVKCLFTFFLIIMIFEDVFQPDS